MMTTMIAPTSTTSTTTTKNHHQKKKYRVSFDRNVTLTAIEIHHDFTSYERLSSWYTKKDYRSFKLAEKCRILNGPISKQLEKIERSQRAAFLRMLQLLRIAATAAAAAKSTQQHQRQEEFEFELLLAHNYHTTIHIHNDTNHNYTYYNHIQNHIQNHNHNNPKTKQHDEEIGNNVKWLIEAVCKYHTEYFTLVARLSGVENELDLLSSSGLSY